MRIAIAGAGAVGRSVAQELVDCGHKVLLIEKEFTRYAPSTVPRAEWFLADACEVSSLEEAQVQICDVAIAATGDDKANLAMAFLASGSHQVIATLRAVTDAGAGEITSAFYRQSGVADPARVLAHIQAELAQTSNEDWPNFVLFGHDTCRKETP